jgi:hypothetical protein
MVEPTFLVALAVAFALGLILIWRQNTPTHVVEKKRPGQNEKKIKAQKKQKGPQRNSLKKDKRPQDVREWTGVDTAQKDAQEMLEFLKGKDPNEIAKQLGQGKPSKKKVQAAAAAKKAKQAEESEDSASEGVSEDGFEKIVKKVKKEKKEEKKGDKKKEGKKGAEDKGPKAFFKVEGEKSGEEKKPKRKPAEGELGERKRKERPEGERKERPEGEKRERRERPEGERPEGERKERPDRPVRKPIPTVAPIVKYEQADLTDILDSITQDFDNKPKPKTNRVSSDFSKIPRNIVISILAKVEARDLVALSRVNHHFSGLARKESLWKDLLQRDFGLKDMGKHRTFRIAYKAEFKRRRAAKKQRKEEEKAVVEAPPAAAATEETKDEQPEKEVKQPKQKKDNKKKKADEQPADGAAED